MLVAVPILAVVPNLVVAVAFHLAVVPNLVVAVAFHLAVVPIPVAGACLRLMRHHSSGKT